MINLHFDIRDLFRVIRLGWSGKKIWTGLCGLVVAYVGYSVLVTVGLLASGTSGSEIWHRYGLFPGVSPGNLPMAGAVLHIIAMVFAVAVFYITSCMMCKITYQQLRGDDFYSSGDAYKFVKEHWGGAVFGPIAVLVLLLLFIIGGIVIGWLGGLIPYLGEFFFAVFFIPIFFAALVALFVIAALAVSLIFTPAIVGTAGEDTLEVVIQSFSICWSQPWRVLLYTAWAGASIFIGATLLSGLMTLSVGLIAWACGLGMGDKLVALLHLAQGYLPPVDFSVLAQVAMPELEIPWEGLSGSTDRASILWSGRILGVMMIILTGVFLAYVQAAYASGASLIYIVLRQKKDDENMLEWEDPDLDDLDFSKFDDDDSDEGDSEGSDGGMSDDDGEEKQDAT